MMSVVEHKLAELARSKGADAALEAAREHLACAETHLAWLEQTLEVPLPQWPAAKLKQAILDRIEAAARVALLELAGNGAGTNWTALTERAPIEVAAELLRRFCGRGSTAAVWLVDRLEEFLVADQAELDQLRPQFDAAAARDHYEPTGRTRVARLLALEGRIPIRQRTLDAWRDQFAARCRAAVAVQMGALVSGLFESLVTLGRLAPPDPEIAATEKKLEAMGQELESLTLGAGDLIAPGPRAEALCQERAALTDRLQLLRTEFAARVAGDVRGLADRAAAGNLESWSRVVQTMGLQPGSFPPGLADRLTTAAADALLAGDTAFWSRVLEAAVCKPPWRDF